MKGQHKLDVLRKSLASADEGERLYAVEDLCEAGVPESVPYLVISLKAENSQVVRDAMLFALKKLDCSGTYPSIFELFRSEDAYLRNAAVSIFGAGGDDAVAFLASRLDEADREVRKMILDALMETGLPHARLAIRAGLHDTAPNVRITAVEYLGRLRDTGSVGEMLALFRTDPEPMLRATIMEALSSVGDIGAIKAVVCLIMLEEGVNDLNRIHLPQLMKLVGMTCSEEDVARILGSVPDVDVYAEDIITMLGQAKKRLGGVVLGREAQDALHHLVAAPSLREDLQYGALALLARSGTARARKTIEEILNKADDEDLRSFCRECLDAGPVAGGKL
ncbi:MAG: HEAT repeat domain-containing protein [Syntrophorhabdales bacterium]|jgi:HEAT repeat protein